MTLKEANELKENIICYNSQLDIAILNNLDDDILIADNEIKKIKQQAKANLGKLGCEKEYADDAFDYTIKCGHDLNGGYYEKELCFCPDCQAAKEIYEEILG